MNLREQIIKKECEDSFEFFVKYAFKSMKGSPFILQDFHHEIIQTLEKVYRGEIDRLIINMPPRHGKSELVKLFISWIMAKNPSAKNIILSYSEDLATEISAHARDYLMQEPINDLFGTELLADSKSKSHWIQRTEERFIQLQQLDR